MIIFVGGTKGGVGKSLVSMSVLNMFIKNQQNPILIETDNANPDVHKSYNGKCTAFAFDVKVDRGWENLLDVIGENSEKDNSPVVINSGAGNVESILKYGSTLNLLPNLTTLWVVNPLLDGLILLTKYLQIVKQKVCVVKNLAFAESESDFKEFDTSNLKKNGMPSVTFPVATSSVIQAIYGKERKAIHELSGCLSFGARLLAAGWIEKSLSSCQAAIENATVYTDRGQSNG